MEKGEWRVVGEAAGIILSGECDISRDELFGRVNKFLRRKICGWR